jgi:DNA-directed RNA polymerase specialized sigma24 family protein
MEDGLNYLLQNEGQREDGAALDRVVASAARRNRYNRALLAKYIIVRTEVQDDAGRIEARSSLALLQRLMPPEKFDLLVELASGTEPERVAAKRGIPVGAMRTRAARARQVARDLAA